MSFPSRTRATATPGTSNTASQRSSLSRALTPSLSPAAWAGAVNNQGLGVERPPDADRVTVAITSRASTPERLRVGLMARPSIRAPARAEACFHPVTDPAVACESEPSEDPQQAVRARFRRVRNSILFALRGPT